MEPFLNWLNAPWGIVFGRILFVSFSGFGIGAAIKKAGDIFGFFSTPKKKEFIHNVAEFISLLFNLVISFVIFYFSIFITDHPTDPEVNSIGTAAGYALVYGSLAMGLNVLMNDPKRLLKVFKIIGAAFRLARKFIGGS